VAFLPDNFTSGAVAMNAYLYDEAFVCQRLTIFSIHNRLVIDTVRKTVLRVSSVCYRYEEQNNSSY